MSTAAPKSDTVTWRWCPRLYCAREVTPRVITGVFKASCFSLKFPKIKKIRCEGISQLFLIYAVKMQIVRASRSFHKGRTRRTRCMGSVGISFTFIPPGVLAVVGVPASCPKTLCFKRWCGDADNISIDNFSLV